MALGPDLLDSNSGDQWSTINGLELLILPIPTDVPRRSRFLRILWMGWEEYGTMAMP